MIGYYQGAVERYQEASSSSPVQLPGVLAHRRRAMDKMQAPIPEEYDDSRVTALTLP